MDGEKKLSRSLAENMAWLSRRFDPSEDLYRKPVRAAGVEGMLCIFEGLSDLEKMWVMAGQAIAAMPQNEASGPAAAAYLLHSAFIPLDKTAVQTRAGLVQLLTGGACILLLEGSETAIAISSQKPAGRSVGEPSGEGSLRGGHEGFVELLRVNIGLVRRLVRAPGLHCEIFTVGRSTATETALLYCGDKCPPQLVDTVRSRICSAGLDLIFDPGYLLPFLVRGTFGIFTPAGFTERPDTAAARLCEGKLLVLVNGSPFAMVLPHFFSEHFQSMDDYVQRPYFTGFLRLLRYGAFAVSVLLPGAFVAVAAFTPELLSPQLLRQLARAQMTTPLPLFQELLAVNLLLEIIREAGLRLPRGIGHTVGLVAALIVGDAAVQAGLLGTPVLVVCALAGLCSYVVPTLYEPGIVLRLGFILAGGLAGPVGMAMLGCFCLLNLCRPAPFGIPYTVPLTPANRGIWRDGMLRASWRSLTRRPAFGIKELYRCRRLQKNRGKGGESR